MNSIIKDILEHTGVLRRSGRYPWGSGENPNQRSGDFISRMSELKKLGKSDTEVAEAMGLTTGQYRIQKSLAVGERKTLLRETARGLREDGLSLDQIAQKMGYANDSSVRSLLNEDSAARTHLSRKTADFLKEQVDQRGMIEVGAGVNLSNNLRVSSEKLKEALYILELEGYPTYGGRVDQVTNPGRKTTITVLCPPGTEHKEIYKLENIHMLDDYVSPDGGESFRKFEYPSSMDSNRLQIRYAEEGGNKKDGVIELRRGVDDLSLGESHYAQVRILVDDTKYLKGMALYSDDMPEGVDVVFNTNKQSNVPKMEVLKKIGKDPANPFGSLIKEVGGQSRYDDPNGKYVDPVTGKKQSLSLINKRAEEGDWSEWSDNLPSQFLSKQPKHLIDKQLGLAKADKTSEYEDLVALTNPTVKKIMLNSFAEDCDSAAVHLQAAALPRQKYKVILPITTLKDDEVYAPSFENGEKVALIRFPHGGTFEIPILTVNTKHPDSKRILADATDAIGINSKVAERLSGADFDGDTVMVIPISSKVKIQSSKALKDLEGFDAKLEYGADKVEEDADGVKHTYRGNKEFRPMKNTQTEMGKISNLITDMTLKGAIEPELAKAVKHSMVVIDAEKHNLDYRQSELDNNIAFLKKKYQGRVDEEGKYRTGASTLISRSKSETTILKRKGSPIIDKETGEVSYKLASEPYKIVKYKDPTTGELTKPTKFQLQKYREAIANGRKTEDFVVEIKSDGDYDIIKYQDPITGKKTNPTKEQKKQYYDAVAKGEDTSDFIVKTKARTQASTEMADTKDARTLSSGLIQETLYADYANTMKALANQARKEMVTTGDIKYSPAAKIAYQTEVNTLTAKLSEALKNAPRERYAQTIANAQINAKKQDNPDMSRGEIKKASQMALTAARKAVGAKRTSIDLSDREWEAIQAGAISPNQLMKIINNMDDDKLRERATPRAKSSLSTAQVNRITAMRASGYNTGEIAKAMGKSASTISNYLSGKE